MSTNATEGMEVRQPFHDMHSTDTTNAIDQSIMNDQMDALGIPGIEHVTQSGVVRTSLSW